MRKLSSHGIFAPGQQVLLIDKLQYNKNMEGLYGNSSLERASGSICACS
jgi:hypothetical protein